MVPLFPGKELPVIEFKVPDMSCGHCVGVVTKAVKSIDPQAEVRCDLPTHTVRVDSGEDREAIAAALADAGYPAS
jgi:copper chaperone